MLTMLIATPGWACIPKLPCDGCSSAGHYTTLALYLQPPRRGEFLKKEQNIYLKKSFPKQPYSTSVYIHCPAVYRKAARDSGKHSLHSGQLCLQLEILLLGIKGEYWGAIHIFPQKGIRQRSFIFKGFQHFKVNGFHLSNISVSHLSNKRIPTGWALSFLPALECYDSRYSLFTTRAFIMITFYLLQANTFCWQHIWFFLQLFSLLNWIDWS